MCTCVMCVEGWCVHACVCTYYVCTGMYIRMCMNVCMSMCATEWVLYILQIVLSLCNQLDLTTSDKRVFADIIRKCFEVIDFNFEVSTQ